MEAATSIITVVENPTPPWSVLEVLLILLVLVLGSTRENKSSLFALHSYDRIHNTISVRFSSLAITLTDDIVRSRLARPNAYEGRIITSLFLNWPISCHVSLISITLSNSVCLNISSGLMLNKW